MELPIKELLPEIPAAFPPEESTRTRACTQERNRSRDEIRLLCTAPTTRRRSVFRRPHRWLEFAVKPPTANPRPSPC